MLLLLYKKRGGTLKMKKSLNYWVVGGFEKTYPIDFILEKVKSWNFDAIELAFGSGELSYDVSYETLDKVKKSLEKYELELSSLAAGFYWEYSLSDPDEKIRKKSIELSKKYIEVAHYLNADTVLVIPGYVDVGWVENSPVVPYDLAISLARESLSELLEFAESKKITLALENVWNKLFLSPLEMRDFIDSFKSNYIGSYFDVGNVVIFGYPEHWINILGNRIKRIHVKNFKRSDAGGGLHNFGESILEGDVNWHNVLQALKKIGYDGYLTVEMIPFCRLPELNLPDLKLAEKMGKEIEYLINMYENL